MSRRQLKQPRSCREDGRELLAPGTSFVRHVRPWSVYSLLPPAAVSMDTELLQQPQRDLRHRAVHPFTSHEPRAEPGPRHACWLSVAAAAALGCLHQILLPHACSAAIACRTAHTTPRDGLFSCPGSSHVQHTIPRTSPRHFWHEDQFRAHVWCRKDKDAATAPGGASEATLSSRQRRISAKKAADALPPAAQGPCGCLCWEHWCFQRGSSGCCSSRRCCGSPEPEPPLLDALGQSGSSSSQWDCHCSAAKQLPAHFQGVPVLA